MSSCALGGQTLQRDWAVQQDQTLLLVLQNGKQTLDFVTCHCLGAAPLSVGLEDKNMHVHACTREIPFIMG